MCGIAGEIGPLVYVGRPSNVADEMAKALHHRGPDETGYYHNDHPSIACNLVSTRLAIIDREHGQQPMHAYNYAYVYNGEIYNHKTMRDESWVDRKTNCDGEAIGLALLDDNNKGDWVSDLDGQFAIAAWNRHFNVLTLARDRLGQKPLYYYFNEHKRVFIFASEIKAILLHPIYSPEPDYDALAEYLVWQYIPEPKTAFKGIRAVMPGHVLTYDARDGTISETQYWRHDKLVGSEVDISPESVRDTVTAAITSRLETEVPMGVYLSGGLDSTIVAGVAAQHVKDLHTFSMGFTEAEYDESAYAQLAAQAFNTNHHTEMVTLNDLEARTRQVVDVYDQPFGDCSAIPCLILAEKSKPHFTVALNGDGGDEAFGGYERHIHCNDDAHYPRFLMVWKPEQLRQMAGPRLTNTRGDFMPNRNKNFNDFDRNAWLSLDTTTYLPNDIIVKIERAAMAYSIEARSPFLDHRVVEMALCIPWEKKVMGKISGKLILKEAFKDLVPAQITNRPKRGFSVPVNEWFRTPKGFAFLSATLLGAKNDFGIVDRGVVGNLLAQHQSGKMTIGHGLYMLAVLNLWMRKHFGN